MQFDERQFDLHIFGYENMDILFTGQENKKKFSWDFIYHPLEKNRQTNTHTQPQQLVLGNDL